MKPLLTLLTILLAVQLTAQGYADQFYKDYASPSPEDVNLKSFPFAPDANAIILRKDATVIPDGYKMFSYIRTRIKILKPTGSEEGNIKLRYYHAGEVEKITNLSAVTINYDAQGTKKMATLTNKDIHYTKEDQYYTTITFSMPDVREGSIIEYSYISERRNYKVIDYWYFQDELPVLHALFDYTIMPGAEFSYRVLKSSELPINLKENKTEGRLIFTMDNLPGVSDEPFMDAKRDYLSRVELQMNSVGSSIERQKFVATWPELTQELLRDEDFGQAIQKKIAGTEELISQAKMIGEVKDRMNFIYRNVQQRLNWDRYIGIYATEKLKTVWEKKQGSTAEINIILLNLLNAAEVPASPLLVSDRSHGKVSTSHPFISQFSKVVAYVEIGGKPYFLDASGNQVKTELIPESLLNTQGYLVERKTSRFVKISDPLHFEKRNVSIAGKISDMGILTGQVFVSDQDYARMRREPEVRRSAQSYIREIYVDPYARMKVDSFVIRNLEHDSLSLDQLVNFNFELEKTGDYYLLTPNLFGGIEKNPFLADNRYTEINFGCKKLVTFSESFELGEGFVIEALPKAMALRTADTGLLVSRMTDQTPDGKRFVVKMRLEINKTLYTAAEYESVKEFFKKMYGVLNDPIVLKKKP